MHSLLGTFTTARISCCYKTICINFKIGQASELKACGVVQMVACRFKDMLMQQELLDNSVVKVAKVWLTFHEIGCNCSHKTIWLINFSYYNSDNGLFVCLS